MKMKRIYICILLLLAVCIGCVPTPEHEIVENKGDKKDWQVDAQPVFDTVLIPMDAEAVAAWDYEQQDSPLYERLNAPKLWNMENNEFGFPIAAKDCPVYLPNVTAVPAAEAETRAITQEDVDAVISVVFPVDGVKWYPEVGTTKEDCVEVIRKAQEALEKAEPGSEQYDILKKKLEEKNEYYSKIYAIAPFAADIQPIEPVLGTYQRGYNTDFSVYYINGLDVHASVADEEWTLSAHTSNEIYGDSIYASRNGDLWSDNEQPLDAPYGVQMTRAEALQKATEIAQKLTDGELSPCYCTPVYFRTNEGPDLSRRFSQWRVVLMRTFNGVGSAYAKEDVGSAMDSTVAKPVAYERMTIDMDDHGVSALKWINPMRVTGVVQSDAQLISFDEAANKAMQQIAARWATHAKDEQDAGRDPTIWLQRVTFGLWRIAKKNGGWYYVPVYHFFTKASVGNWATQEGLWSEDATTPRSNTMNSASKREKPLILKTIRRIGNSITAV